MKISYSQYTLEAPDASRDGALLRFSFEDGLVGYADCHPWESLGDKSLKEQLHLLKNKHLTKLTRRSFHFARLDALARSEGKSIFKNLRVPQSHFLLTQLDFAYAEKALEEGYRVFKIKLGSNIHHETPLLCKLLPHLPKVRLDFNNKLTVTEFETFLKEIEPFWSKIDFIEDPFPFQPQLWNQIQNKYPIHLACDHHCIQAINNPQAAHYLVLKPAVEEAFDSDIQKLIVTSYLDHPLGQLCAAYTAASGRSAAHCGLNSHRRYVKNEFSAQLSWHGPYFEVPAGTGFGFDGLLEKQNWIGL